MSEPFPYSEALQKHVDFYRFLHKLRIIPVSALWNVEHSSKMEVHYTCTIESWNQRMLERYKIATVVASCGYHRGCQDKVYTWIVLKTKDNNMYALAGDFEVLPTTLENLMAEWLSHISIKLESIFMKVTIAVQTQGVDAERVVSDFLTLAETKKDTKTTTTSRPQDGEFPVLQVNVFNED